jgi:hypothetical protein
MVARVTVAFSTPSVNDRDTLLMYYSADGGTTWMLMDTLNSGNTASAWVNRTIELTNPTATYKLAFEARRNVNLDATRSLLSGSGINWFRFDTVAPTLDFVSSNPADGATNIGVTTNPAATFSRTIAQGPNFAGITLVDSKGVSYKGNVTVNGAVLTIGRTGNFFDTTTYTVTIPAGAIQTLGTPVQNQAVTWSFTTGTQSLQSGTFTPFNNATNQNLNVAVSLTFLNNVVTATEEGLAQITIRKVNINISGTDTTYVVADTVQGVVATLNTETKTLHIAHPDFEEETMYQVTIPANSLDRQTAEIHPGPSATPVVPWRFTTRRLEPNPAQNGRTPANNATNVALDTEVSQLFDMAIANYVVADSLAKVTLVATVSGEPVAITTTIDDRKLIINHPDFAPNTQYTVRIPSRAAGQVAVLTWSFTTGSGSSIAELEIDNAVMVYPNPVSDVLYLQTNETVQRVDIFNLQGQLVKQIFGNVNHVNVADLPTGMYVLNVITDNGVAKQRIIKN